MSNKYILLYIYIYMITFIDDFFIKLVRYGY